MLLEDPNSLIKLRNGNENQVFIPYHVLLELNKIKKNPKLRHIVARVIEYLVENPDAFKVLNSNSVADLVAKFHRLRPANKIFIDGDVYPSQFNPKNFEILPLAYIRGMNIENAVVIITSWVFNIFPTRSGYT